MRILPFLKIGSRFILAAALAVACVHGMAAQAAASGNVVISAAAPDPRPAPTAGRGTITAADIAAAGIATLPEAVEMVPGVLVSANGAAGAQASVSIRGSTASQVLVIVDGVPVSDPSTGLADFSRLGLSAEDVESIELIRGGASAQFGPDAVGGVIAITTKRAVKGEGVRLEVVATNLSFLPGDSKTGSGASTVDLPPDYSSLADGQTLGFHLDLPSGLRLSASGSRADNAYLYEDADAIPRLRGNAGLLAGSASLSWKGAVGFGDLSTAVGGNLRSLEVPGSLSYATPDASQEDAGIRANLSFSTDRFFLDPISATLSAYAQAQRTLYRETQGEEGDLNLATRYGAEGRWSILASQDLVVGIGLSGSYQRLESGSVKTLSGGCPERMTFAVFAEPTISFGDLTLSPAARFDVASDFPSVLSFSLGAAYALTDHLSVSANAATAARSPSFDDLYWPSAYGTEGNPSLKPETSVGGDIGLEFKNGWLSLSTSAYLRYTEDVIAWAEGDDGIWRPSNLGTALFPGMELSITARLPSSVAARLAWNYLRSYQLTGGLSLADDLRVPNTPGQGLGLDLSWSPAWGSLGVSIDYKGRSFTSTDNQNLLPASLLVNARVSVRTGTWGELAVEIDNLLNQSRESVEGYPMPGLSLRSSFRARL